MKRWLVLCALVGAVAGTAWLMASRSTAISQAPASSALIKLADLSDGWDEQEQDTFGNGLILCGVETLRVPGSEEAATSFELASIGPFIINTVELSDAATAQRQIDHVRALPVPCSWEDTADDITATSRVIPLPFPALGEDSIAFRYESEVASAALRYESEVAFARVVGEFVFIRRGRAFAILALGAAATEPEPPKVDSTETLRLARLLDERLKVIAR